MIPACTHELRLELDDHTINLNDASEVYVTLEQDYTSMTFSGDELEIDGYKVNVFLTQEQSLKFSDFKPAKVQVNWIFDGSPVLRAATDPAIVNMGEQLLRVVLP